MDQSKPIIEPIRSMINPHLKHFLQQAQHTLCTTINDKAYYFGNHQKILGDSEAPQDRLWHFKLLATERSKVLSLLNKVNLNSFSLFNSEEGLMDAIAKENFPFS